MRSPVRGLPSNEGTGTRIGLDQPSLPAAVRHKQPGGLLDLLLWIRLCIRPMVSQMRHKLLLLLYCQHCNRDP